MINENFEITMKEGGKPLEEGMYQVELFDISVEKRPTYDTRNNPKEEQVMENTLKFHFVVLDEENRKRGLWRNFIPAYFYIGNKGKNVLIQIVEAFLRRELTQDELYSFNTSKLNKLIGHQVIVGVKNNKSGEKIYSNIEGFYKIKKQLTKLSDEEKQEIKDSMEKAENEKKNKMFDQQTLDQQTEEEQHLEHDEIPTIQVGEDDQVNIDEIPF